MPRPKVDPVGAESADLVEDIAQYYDDPLGFVRAVFPWGQEGTILHDQEGPDEWQSDLLTTVGEEVRRRAFGEAMEAALRAAVVSGNGVGKSACVSWLILWFISTRSQPQIKITANTKTQLTGKTWRELAKWHKLMVHRDWFQWTATKLYLKSSPEDWYAEIIPWSKNNPEAFSGTHEKHVLQIFDEASGIEDEIWDMAEGAMTTPGAMWFVFGNPNRNTGRFRECWRRFRHRWLTFKVDSRTAKMADKAQIQAWIDDYGEDSDFVRIRVRGEFPRAASNQLIGEDLILSANKRWKDFIERAGWEEGRSVEPLWEVVAAARPLAPKILTVDVARYGDDQSVIGLRVSDIFIVLGRHRELDTEQLAWRVARFIDEIRPDAVFVDAVGIGAGVFDKLKHLGYEATEVNGGFKAAEQQRYFNKRAEMWVGGILDWLRKGAILQPDDQIKDDLTGLQYGFDDKGRFQLETKDDMKSRGMPSPDTGDALAQSFFMPVSTHGTADKIMAEMLARQRMSGSWMAM